MNQGKAKINPIDLSDSSKSHQVAALVAVGFFVTTLGQPAQVGGLPLRLLLKDELHITASVITEAAYGFCYTVAVLPVFDLAARATPKGCEAMRLAAVMSLWNVANAVSDISGHGYSTSIMSTSWDSYG